MKLLIIGGTGKTGRQLIAQALEQGHQVTAMVRKPGKVKLTHSHLRVCKGNVLSLPDLTAAVQNQDAVLSALGHKRFFIKTSILSQGTKNIILAMEKQQVKRLIAITSLGINDSRYKLGLYYTLFVIPVILWFYFKDKSKQEKLIMESNLDWTIVRPGQLTNGRMKSDYQAGEKLGHYILTPCISRVSVADFMLKQLNDNTYIHKTPAVIN
ncbi:Putative NADH-flavin reductase [Arenibacter nanhaiticus]|uniref:Putative NADH-flavin reductase n=1 Tax=Arenibacter nanhaiticus TaxID=558155 RepID=A0A1M6DPQ4_9FLAO|nr:SDR family oxidoreductase [Arenibacter nanhaiticus]SHI75254.1 Putative NADH-flavin reductase [Arenibacter nanhaiticus]